MPLRVPPTLGICFSSVFYWVTYPFLSVLVWENFVCALQRLEPCFHQSCGSLVIKPYWSSAKVDSLGIPSPLSQSSEWEADMGYKLHTSVKSSYIIVLQFVARPV